MLRKRILINFVFEFDKGGVIVFNLLVNIFKNFFDVYFFD